MQSPGRELSAEAVEKFGIQVLAKYAGWNLGNLKGKEDNSSGQTCKKIVF